MKNGKKTENGHGEKERKENPPKTNGSKTKQNQIKTHFTSHDTDNRD